MKLRRSVSPHQLLFAILAGLFLTLSASAQDQIVFKDGKSQTGKILGVSGANVQVQVGSGNIGYPLANIARLQMAEPPQLAEAQKAYAAGDFTKALTITKAIADRFTGLPVPWAQQAAGLLGDIYVELEQFPNAEKAYTNFQRYYGTPGSSARTDVGMARIAVAKKDFATAKGKLEPIAAAALQEKTPPRHLATSYSQTFYLLGQVYESEQKYPEALENYLLTVTLFPQDKAAVAGAQKRADNLRKEHSIAVP